MENSWKRKCGTMWQSTAAPVVFSSQEPQNQILNAGYHFRSCVQTKPTSSARRMPPESFLPWTSSLSSYNLDHAELGSSLLSQFSSPQCITPPEVPIALCNASGLATGNELSLLTSGLLSQNLNSQNVEAGSELCSLLSSKARVSANHGSKSGPSNVLQDVNKNLEKLEFPKAGMHQNLSSNENGLLCPSLRVGNVNGSIPSNAWKLHNSRNTEALHKSDPSVSCSSSTLTTGCPRVFCLNLSGDLLLSNTGLLGVVCSCHGFHMSITKFSEHSGLCNMNPGDAVRLDSGETIAQWRKVYFHKFGIKIPEAHCGWDWPEELPVTVGLVKHCPTVPNVSKISDLCNQDSSLASVQSFNLWNNTMYPKNFHMVQKVPDQFAHNEKQRNAQEFLVSSSKNNLHSVAKNHKMMYLRSESPKMSNLLGVKGPDNVCQAVSSYIVPISKSGDPFVFNSRSQNLKTLLGEDTGIGRNSGSLVQRDIVSSNVELRLGQPSQQGQSSGSSIQPAFGPHIMATHGQPPNSFSLEQHVPKSCSKSAEDRSQHSYLGNCLSSRRIEQSQLDHQISGVSNAVADAFQIEELKGGAAGGSVISKSFAHLKYPLEGRFHPKSINEVVSGSHVIVSRAHSEYPIAETGQFSFPLFRGEASDTEFSSSLTGSQKHENYVNGRSAIGSLQGAAELSFGSHAKSKGSMWSFGGGESGSDCKVYSAGKDESTIMCHFSGGMTDEPDRGNTFNYFGQALYPAQNAQLVSNASRSITRVLSTQAVPMGFSATNSLGIQSLPPLSKKENISGGSNLTGQDARISAMQHTSELSNQNHPTTSFKVIPEQDRLRNFYGKSQVHISSSGSDKRINEINYTGMLKTSEVATQSSQSANFLSSDNAKLSSVTDSDKLCNFAMLSQGKYYHGKDAEIRNHFASDMQSTRQLFLRLGGTDSISPSSEAGKCLQGMPHGCFPSKYSFAVQTNSLAGRYDQKGETILAECKDQEGNAGNVIATLLRPKLGESCTVAEKVDSFGHNENMKQNTKKAEHNSFLWRDVPRKVLGKCSLVCVEKSVDSSIGNVECKDAAAAEAARKCFDKSAKNVGSFKEQEMSNVSSGCSAPVVTQASLEGNNKDSSTVDAEDARYAGNPAVDEGSGIERCWSSDDGVDSERNAEFSGFASELDFGHKNPSKPLLSRPNRSLIDELRFRDSLRLRKMQKQSPSGNCNQEKGILMQKSVRHSKIWKRRPVKWKKLTSSFSPSAASVVHNDALECARDAELHPHLIKNTKMLSQCGQGKFEGYPCAAGRNIKQRSTLSLSRDISQDRDVCRIHHLEEEKTDTEMKLNANSNFSEAMGRKRFGLSGATWALKQIYVQRSNSVDSEVAVKKTPINCNMTCSQPANISQRPQRPVVCGKYGVIANANSLKPAKIVSLRKLLKAPSKCRLPDTNKVDLSSAKLLKKATVKGSNGSFYISSKIKEEVNGNIQHPVHNELNPQHSVDELKTAYSVGNKDSDNLSHVMKKRRCHGNKTQVTPDGFQIIELRRKYKEVRKRSLHELTTKENHSSYMKFPIMKNVKSIPQTKSRFLCRFTENAEADKISANGICNAKISAKDDKCLCTWDLNIFCCVCGSSSKDENNDLLECCHCLIKVHQACYGISKVPKAHWYCRPCKTSSKNIVCVLCGYGGGAMTRALHSQNTMKSLLQAWTIMAESNSKKPGCSKSSENQIKRLSSSNSLGEGDPFLVIRPAHKDLPSLALCNKDLSEYKDSITMLSPGPASVECNSITAGVLDSTVKQWVHMVCGLWTPGTRCPNVGTMSAFDVSGACSPKPDAVCSICERLGGCCIRCRVIGCKVQFHPWCAHQKGLLQSEVEGDANESVGFYGRCVLHAMNHHFGPDSCHLDSGNANHGEKKLTCARTEGYKGRKREGVHYNLPPHSDGCGGSVFVPQEQLDAWIHINKQKPHRKVPLKFSTLEIEHCCRKEYARYKQSRGWKHLVVYKSGIHGLGLYTSQFISRGAMVVEYVGEIVGLHVADKRETEYQSGKKLQYKSACYFFRIDKEYIIDATRKGGIARFVNHSCQPNCVAEIISVRNEKKVVFFAERDIYPGEEITYDYHFNHEDEGKKIPCYCNSKNCRRYLN